MEVLRSTERWVPPIKVVSGSQLRPLSTRMASRPDASESSTSAPMVKDLPLPVSAQTSPWKAFGPTDLSHRPNRKNSPEGVSSRLDALFPPHHGKNTGRKS